ncbi:heme biosynthesis operon protein HemX [Corallincola holothuriorum]|uniref:Heme biosynthesis operon protein HemX n=1 Tax=Corallincola holothuriorum TaxID=2282215 RepID=A0A368N7D8_9GAMM|nr:uroporphyrinogen-III C-methyltransferase [Corallincola holothuriorum]RCU45501.1 heme biosynthesis operon protein HemX [Corallincola holothuriorum]
MAEQENNKNIQPDADTSSAKAESTTPSPAKTEPQPKAAAVSKAATNSPAKSRLAQLALLLSVIAIALLLFISYHLYQRGHDAGTDIAELKSKALQQQLQLDKMQPLNQLSAKIGALKLDWDGRFERQSVEMDRLSNTLLSLASRQPSDWLLAETNYLVRLAGHKLWLEHDVTTSLMLLREADQRLAELQDPSLIPLRADLAKDMAALKALPDLDRSEIALTLSALTSQVTELPLKGVVLPDLDEAIAENRLSHSPEDWKDNLIKTWHSFADDFITIRKRTDDVEPLLAPDQRWYLQENLRAKLMLAQLALFREQQGVYQDALATAHEWINTYFIDDSDLGKSMQAELLALQKHNIEPSYPEDFMVRQPLERILEKRLKSLLQSDAPVQQDKAVVTEPPPVDVKPTDEAAPEESPEAQAQPQQEIPANEVPAADSADKGEQI